jgi:hypothetical protein
VCWWVAPGAGVSCLAHMAPAHLVFFPACSSRRVCGRASVACTHRPLRIAPSRQAPALPQSRPAPGAWLALAAAPRQWEARCSSSPVGAQTTQQGRLAWRPPPAGPRRRRGRLWPGLGGLEAFGAVVQVCFAHSSPKEFLVRAQFSASKLQRKLQKKAATSVSKLASLSISSSIMPPSHALPRQPH